MKQINILRPEGKIRIIKAEDWNWYNVGDEFTIKDVESYLPLGVQVYRDNNGKVPDIVQLEHFECV